MPNFKTSEGDIIKSINQIVAEDLQQQLESNLMINNKFTKEFQKNLVNTRHNVSYKNQIYNNIKYAYGCTTLEGIKETFRIMMDSFNSEVSPDEIVSFRQPIEIDQWAPDKFVISFRAARIKK